MSYVEADHTRDPCPLVIISDFGGAFAMGAIGGTVWHGIQGFRNSPRGERGRGALAVLKTRAPASGGNFAAWGGLFSTYDCAIRAVRKKEDIWNGIAAGFFVGASLAIRGGWKQCRRSAITCAAIIGVFESVGAVMMKYQSSFMQPPMEEPLKA